MQPQGQDTAQELQQQDTEKVKGNTSKYLKCGLTPKPAVFFSLEIIMLNLKTECPRECSCLEMAQLSTCDKQIVSFPSPHLQSPYQHSAEHS